MATTGLMAMDTTTERGLLRLSPRPLLMLLLRLLLIPGTDTTAMASTMAMDTTDTGLMAMDTTTERGLLRLSPRPLLMLLLRLLLIPGTDTRLWPPPWLWILRIQALWLWILLRKEVCDAEPAAEAVASPEAEADPWYGYYGYGYRPYGYGYYGYRPYGYAYWGYMKAKKNFPPCQLCCK